MSLIEELKRRNVFRVCIAYVAIAWLLLQVADVVLNNIDAPGWVFRVILLVLALGFPLAVFFAWAFELTPEGLKKEEEVDRSRFIASRSGRKLDFLIFGLMAIALAWFAWDRFLPDISEAGRANQAGEPAPSPAAMRAGEKRILESRNSPSAPAERSIAVLPFADMSAEGDQEYLSDGIAEELLNLLVQIPDLQVAARTSSFSFKGKDVKIADVARELHVAHILEGSVRKAGDRVRITAQLIKAADGFHLWSQTFDRTLEDIFAIQDEIAAAVVAALKLKLPGAAPKTVAVNPEAFSLYLQGRFFFERRWQNDWANAEAAYRQALEIDPGYAAAWAGLSLLYSQFPIEVPEWQTGARDAAIRALQLDPNLAEGHVALGGVQLFYDWDWIGAEASMQRAMELAPGDARILTQMGLVQRYRGNLAESVELSRRAVELDPLVLGGYHSLGATLTLAGELDEALAIYDRLLVLNPEFTIAHLARSRILLLQGKPEEALAAAEREADPFFREYSVLLSLYALGRTPEADQRLEAFIDQNHDAAAYQIAQIYGVRGDQDKVFEWLDLAYLQRDGGLPEMLSDPFLAKFSGDPRWTELLKKVGLYEAWLRTRA